MPALFCRFVWIIGFTLLVTTTVQGAPGAERGILDLTRWDFRRDGVVSLNGEWEFYAQAFLLDEEVPPASEHPQRPTYIAVPGAWNRYPDRSGAPMGGHGYATYRLRIDLPDGTGSEGHVGDPGVGEMAIYIPYVNTSYELWVDGELLSTSGIVGRSSVDAVPQFRPEIARFQPQGRQVDLVLHVSNFHFRNGGLPRSLEIGAADQVALKQRRLEAAGAAQFGAVFIMAVFFGGIYALRRANLSDAFFSLFLLTIAVRILVTGDHLLARVTMNFPWELGLTIEYLTTYLSPTLFLYYLRTLFPEDVSGRVVRGWTLIAVGGSVASLLLPGRLSSQLIPTYLLISPLRRHRGYASWRYGPGRHRIA